ncbi:hypothetical protein SEA_MCGALLEON_45 [Microbacterium phage McGalleon]|uniref:Uncharacterized protein n=1 Tax=Microbacterium phage McGalleon TaxID=2590936 RepID=A0A516KQX4_9CAUD|nr:hypothetical protein H3N88_gp45 [Microbacterium phage McGalleon]QDP44096.1 hypothetical protein SEA_MCGALLEON_45 [Microbacterium phage McGalleon]
MAFDIDREFAAAEKRIQRNIDRNVLIALARIEGMTPQEYAQKLDAERAEQAAVSAREAGIALGRAYGEMAKALTDAVNNIAEGFRQAFAR